MMHIEYLAKTGDFQIKIDSHRYVLSPEKTVDGETTPQSDVTGEPQIIKDLTSTLWAIPATRDTTPHNKLVFSERDYVVYAGSLPLTPESDASTETEEARAFYNTIYNYNDGEYAARWQSMQEEEDVLEGREWTDEEKIEHAARTKRSEIRRDYTSAMDQIAGQYPDRERETWHKQLSEARALDADPEAATPYIDACIAESGEDKTEFADNILGKDAAYAKHAGQAAGVMRRRLRELEAATTAKEIEAV